VTVCGGGRHDRNLLPLREPAISSKLLRKSSCTLTLPLMLLGFHQQYYKEVESMQCSLLEGSELVLCYGPARASC